MPSSERASSRRLRWIVTLAALPAGLLVCELWVRARGLAPLPAPVQRGDALQPDDDPVLRFVPKPGGRSVVRLVDAPGAAPRVVEAHVNALGCRGPEVDPTPAEGVGRIACLGDSHTFGFGVADDEIWPAVLGRELDLRFGPGRVEVLAAGVNGYDAEQEALWLERGVLPLEPDLVLWQYFVNDVAMRGLELDPRHEPSRLQALLAPEAGGFVGWLRGVSRAADLVAARVHNRLALDLFGRARAEMYAEDHPAWARVRAALLSGRDACAAREVGLVIVLFPYLHRSGGTLSGAEALAQVAAFCRANDIAVLDLGPEFRPLDVEGLRVHPLDLHFGAEAYAIAARRIAEVLLADETALGARRER